VFFYRAKRELRRKTFKRANIVQNYNCQIFAKKQNKRSIGSKTVLRFPRESFRCQSPDWGARVQVPKRGNISGWEIDLIEHKKIRGSSAHLSCHGAYKGAPRSILINVRKMEARRILHNAPYIRQR
jgi:hypothetical protein